jgi:nucleoid-associated protein YgaU
MGNFEKLVVLTVLFLSAVVVAVSLSSGEEDPAMNPLSDARRTLHGDEVAAADPKGERDAGRPALSAEGRPDRARDASQPQSRPPASPEVAEKDFAFGADTSGTPVEAGAPHGTAPAVSASGHPRVLKTRQGLTESPLPDYMVYTAAEGDTWSLLADRFYKSATYVALLQGANEDLAAPSAGEPILVPVYDFRAAPKDRAPRVVGPARTASSPADAGAAPAASKGGGTYVVAEGDSLWTIAKAKLGQGSRWTEIFEANKDVMSDSDALKVGMTLRIPK